MKKKKRAFAEPMDSEDVEELMSLSDEDLHDEIKEFKKEAEGSQSEAIAKSLAKMPEADRLEALKKMKREDILLFETVEYLLKRLVKR
ncbi:MAG: hypothetical protein H7318_05720 [Oligoflexus sp.]|nr:hypothetical protein [Oligoflexus sp.]